MNISYHYYTVKTLAVKAGFDEEEAQVIAYYSQMVDDFVLSHRVIMKETPPSFFVDNGMAEELDGGMWGFLPCPTGINFLKSVSHGYQKHTLVPFHFITARKLPDIERNPDFSRLDYRCASAGERSNMLIHRIVRDAVQQVRQERTVKNLMRLGMALHTFADTYAHCHFSGFHGFENEAQIRKAYSKEAGREMVPQAERVMFSELPSIGHGNVGVVPDICSYDVAYVMKSSAESPLDYLVERDNTASFARCSRRILNWLCSINDKPYFSSREWQALQTDIAKAQFVKKDSGKLLTESFQRVFPDISYSYEKNGRLSVQLNVQMDSAMEMMDTMLGGVAADGISAYELPAGDIPLTGLMQGISGEVMEDAFSPIGDSRRNMACTVMNHVSEEFFQFNELAYERVKAVTGEYLAQGTLENFRAVCRCDLESISVIGG